MSTPKILHSTKWIHLLEKDGWIYASRRLPGQPRRIDAVNIIAVHSDGQANGLRRLVVLEEFRVPVDCWEFSLPAGLLDAGESIADCGARELKEETGLDAFKIHQHSGLTFSSAGLTDETQAFVMMECHGEASLTPGIEGERIRVHLMTQSDCQSLLIRNQQGEAALSARLWPVLMAFAQGAEYAGIRIS